MTDYLEESLDQAGRLLEQVRKLERELPGLEPETEETGGAERAREDFGPDTSRTQDVSRDISGVYNKTKNVDQNVITVDDIEIFPEIGAEDQKKIVNHAEKNGGESELLPWTAVSPAGETASRTDILRAAEDGPEREGEALAARLEQLDRAAVIPAGKAREERAESGGQGAYPVSLSRPQSGAAYLPAAGAAKEAWPAGSGPEQGRAPSGGETGWTEQADRAFRRDSRRYDGGFYLY